MPLKAMRAAGRAHGLVWNSSQSRYTKNCTIPSQAGDKKRLCRPPDIYLAATEHSLAKAVLIKTEPQNAVCGVLRRALMPTAANSVTLSGFPVNRACTPV